MAVSLVALTFRPIAAADLPALADLWHEVWASGHAAFAGPELTAVRTPERFLARLQPFAGKGLIAEITSEIMGFAYWNGAELDQFHVGAKARGTGLAQKLMTEAESAMAGEGIASAFLFCADGNSRAYRFYEKLGWRNAGLESSPVSDGVGGRLFIDCHRFVK
ncbi:GNAT family N-acetyltransferase [Breoghania sp.]|uniref:GNAT family N-acetyltransferase n=1 Tax=Breoghania sp. TaxID=2065378 RepID=UPI00260232FD|nr:GNAT family N-acetyltransferase [Breoghania sp.]MDJ0933623.1 GNAT family N-acetyltransferase [Breoghania sp.]